jgi:hypothetical protein
MFSDDFGSNVAFGGFSRVVCVERMLSCGDGEHLEDKKRSKPNYKQTCRRLDVLSLHTSVIRFPF